MYNNFSLYFSTGTRGYLELLLICNVKRILISFAYKNPWLMKNIIKRNNIQILCDSGAYTAWNSAEKNRQLEAEQLNKNFNSLPTKEQDKIYNEVDKIGKWKKYLINIDAYAEHLDKHKDIIYKAVNLDVMPGHQGQIRTEQQCIDAAEQGWENYLYLKKKGHDTIHVFHQGEPLWVLDRMLKYCNYIGLSPNQDLSQKNKMRWLDDIFRHILDSNNPKIKLHGFGVTAKMLVNRYPWFSVDSSTYSLTAAMGSILTNYGLVYVSDQNKEHCNHIENKPQQSQYALDKYLIKKIGYGIKSMTQNKILEEIKCPQCNFQMMSVTKRQAYRTRNYANIIYFLELEEQRVKDGCQLTFYQQKTLI